MPASTPSRSTHLPPAPSPSSTLSPKAAPFLPRGSTAEWTRARRWADEDLTDASDADSMPISMAPYRDAIRQGRQPSRPLTRAAPPLLHAQPLPLGGGNATPGFQSAGPRRGKCHHRPRPQLVHAMPPRPVEGHISAHQCLGCHRRISTPDADGWREILHRQVKRPATASVVRLKPAYGGQPASHRPPRHIPTDLDGKCLNCLSTSHQVVTCKLSQRCLQCKGIRHIARDCKWPRHAGNSVWAQNPKPDPRTQKTQTRNRITRTRRTQSLVRILILETRSYFG